MAITATLEFPVDNFLGSSFTKTFPAVDAVATLEYPGTPFDPGQTVKGSNNSEWVFAKAGGTIALGDFVVATTVTGGGSAYTVQSVTDTIARTALGGPVGVAGAAATVNQFIWVQRKGLVSGGANVATGSTASTALNTNGASAGRATGTAGGAGTTVPINNAFVYITTAASNQAIVDLNYPFLGIPT